MAYCVKKGMQFVPTSCNWSQKCPDLYKMKNMGHFFLTIKYVCVKVFLQELKNEDLTLKQKIMNFIEFDSQVMSYILGGKLAQTAYNAVKGIYNYYFS
jgi:hypothetical protein